VDFVESDGDFWAVDVNPAMSFRNAEMKPALVDSVRSLLAERAAPDRRQALPEP
jgi:hypothetical protein